MAITLTQSLTAVGPNITSSFLAIGGTRPYVYAVLPGGAGGTIVASTGVYTAPAILNSDPSKSSDTIRVTDGTSQTATATIVVGNALLLFCNIIQTGLSLADGRVYLWDQKIFQPQDYDLYVAVSVPMCKPFGNNVAYVTDSRGNYLEQQSVNMSATMDVDIISRGPAARDRKEEVILALDSTYAEQQMEANSFFIGKISTNFLNLSYLDGAAIPYRYRISCQMQYTTQKIRAVPYYSQFQGFSVVTDN